MEGAVLELRDLYIGYSDDKNRRIVAHTLNTELPSGVLTCLIGANGVGKSTLMRTMAAFQPPLRGEVYVEGKSIAEYVPRELSERIGVVLTEKNMPADLTVEEVVGLGRVPYTNFWGSLTKHDQNVVDEAISQVGLDALRHRKIQQVSDGERKATANYVPAAAVIRRLQALSGFTGCKGRAISFLFLCVYNLSLFLPLTK